MQSTNSLTVQRRFPVHLFFVFNVDQRLGTIDCKWMIQVSLYKGGEQTGPAKFTWPNGAVREGSKVPLFFKACPLISMLTKHYSMSPLATQSIHMS